MIKMVDKNLILIKYFRDGENKSSISRSLKISRKTVRKYIKEQEDIATSTSTADRLEKGLSSKSMYSNIGRKKRKLTEQIIDQIKLCLERNAKKRKQGFSKQQMKITDIHEYLLSKRYEIGYTTVCNYIRVAENKAKEAFIKQIYSPGDTCEFDWGDVKLKIDGEIKTLNMAVFTSAYSNHRFAKLFYRQDSLAFSQSHIDYFKFTGGVFRQMVYDNMRVVIARFVGRSDKQPTRALLELSNYYKFGFRFCNIRKGNEKGHVERSVEYVRRKAFCIKDEFGSIEQANAYLLKICERLNNTPQKLVQQKTANMLFKQEKPQLYNAAIPYKCFAEEFAKVDKYSTIILSQNRYSVPDFLVGKLLTVKVFAEKIDIYLRDEMVSSHTRSYTSHSWSVKVEHYLTSFKHKPGAFIGSLAFDQLSQEVKNIYTQYFTKDTKGFIELFQYCKDKSVAFKSIGKSIKYLQKVAPGSINKDTILAVLDREKEMKDAVHGRVSEVSKSVNEIEQYAKAGLEEITRLTH